MNSTPLAWVNCDLGAYIYLKNGFAFKSNSYVAADVNTVPVIRISNIDGKIASGQNAIHVSIKDTVAGFEVVQGDLLIAMSGATTGKVGVYREEELAYQNQRVGNIKLHSAKFGVPRFRNHIISFLSDEVLKIAYGGAQPNISASAIESIKIGLPSIAEQQEIATRLDILLAQVETLKGRLDALPAILKRFRQSVLAAAVSGKLTEEWRHTSSLKNWNESNIGELATVATGKTPKRTEKSYWSNGTIPWLTSAATGESYCSVAVQFVTEHAVTECSLKTFDPGTLLLAMYGEGKTRGQVTELKLEATCNQACAAIVADEAKVLRSFIKLRLQENYEETRKAAAGGAQPNLNLSKVREITVHLPPLEEQTVIVRKVEELFAFADKVEQRVKDAQQRVNHLTQSILAKAFRGELTADWREQNPALISGENSAEALLACIKAEREAQKTVKRTVKKKA